MLQAYYHLAKPSMVYGNTITTTAAFLFASRWQFDIALLAATVIGNGLVIASACVFNNVIDRKIDRAMARTQARAMPRGEISVHSALMYGIALAVLGFTIVLSDVNPLSALISFIGFVDYVIFYTLSKRYTSFSTLIGSIAGAMPIVVGYTAITNALDLTAFMLFVILVCWQVPHFYAIAIRRLQEYQAAELPVLPAVYGIPHTKKHIDVYVFAFLLAVCSLTFLHIAGWVYCVIVFAAGITWIVFAAQGFYATDDTRWARKLFLCSLGVLLAFSCALSVGSVLP